MIATVGLSLAALGLPLGSGLSRSRRIRVRTRRPALAVLPLIGGSLGHHIPKSDLPNGLPTHYSPPRFETSGFPPPLPLVRTEVHRTSSDSPAPGPLFPRAGRARPDLSPLPQPSAPHDHPAVRDRCHDHIVTRRVVRPGDTLWSIAATLLCTQDPQRIASFWARIYRLNRALVGSNPDIIFPGQELRLPRARAR